MAKKTKNRRDVSAAFFQRVNGPDFDVKKATEPRGSGRNNSQGGTRGGDSSSGRHQQWSGSSSTEPVSIPYNFVPLLDYIIPAEFYNGNGDGVNGDVIADYRKHVKVKGTHSGYIDITITTETPLFVGGATPKEDDSIWEFYGGREQPIIPGSTIKGMIKQLFKIVTASSFRPYRRGSGIGDFEDRHLYFRDFASRIKPLKDYYMERMITSVTNSRGKQGSETKATAGFIIKTTNNQYFIVPTTFKKRSYNDDGLRHKMKDASIDWGNSHVNIHTGAMGSKKSYMRFAKPGNFASNRIPILQETIDSYKDDKNRTTLNLLDPKIGKTGDNAKAYTGCDDVVFVVPCYFCASGDTVDHFGHGRYYRIAYDLPISAHLPKTIQQQNGVIDLCDSVFGHGSDWAGRVSFSDAHISGKPKVCEPDYPKPLMSPNPTSFQFYLTQDEGPHKHWGHEDATLRGYKMYWHQPVNKASDWKLPDNEEPIKGARRIRPLDRGNVFTGRIHFTSLSTIELGALLLVLQLNSYSGDTRETYYKLGMGKSIGLGSVKIESQVTVFDIQCRYHTLFDESHWNVGDSKVDVTEYIQAFNEYCSSILSTVDMHSYKSMMDDVYTLMDWNIANGPHKLSKWSEATTMMSVDRDPHKRFKNRTKLEGPKEFLKRWK